MAEIPLLTKNAPARRVRPGTSKDYGELKKIMWYISLPSPVQMIPYHSKKNDLTLSKLSGVKPSIIGFSCRPLNHSAIFSNSGSYIGV